MNVKRYAFDKFSIEKTPIGMPDISDGHSYEHSPIGKANSLTKQLSKVWLAARLQTKLDLNE